MPALSAVHPRRSSQVSLASSLLRLAAIRLRFAAALLSTNTVEYLLKPVDRTRCQRKETRGMQMTHSHGGGAAGQPDEALSAIREYLTRLRFGSIEITVHEGRIVQLDVTEKRRLAR